MHSEFINCSLDCLAGDGGRADKGTSLGFAVGRVRPLFALTPSPSPTLWERGVWAHGGAFPLSREAGEGDTGGEGNTARLPNNARTGQMAPTQRIPSPTAVPLFAARRRIGGVWGIMPPDDEGGIYGTGL